MKRIVKIHLLLKKEEIDCEKLADSEKVVVVLDVLLATSTIVASLSFGASKIIPVMNQDEALEKASQFDKGSYCLVGEDKGEVIEGFLEPNPLKLVNSINGKAVILSTTNGTVAILKVACAKKVYIASLLNGKAVAEKMAANHKEDTIIIVCSGSHNRFCMEDFYGAGYLINELISLLNGYELTDAAKAALYFFQSKKENAFEIIEESNVGQKLLRMGYGEEINYISQLGIVPIVPYLEHGSGIIKDTNYVKL